MRVDTPTGCFRSIFLQAALINWLELINKSSKCGWTVRDDWQSQSCSHIAAETEADCQNLRALFKRSLKIWGRQLYSALLNEWVKLQPDEKSCQTLSWAQNNKHEVWPRISTWPTIRSKNALRTFNGSKTDKEEVLCHSDVQKLAVIAQKAEVLTQSCGDELPETSSAHLPNPIISNSRSINSFSWSIQNN